MSGAKIIEGLKDAVAGNFSRVTIEGQVWQRIVTVSDAKAAAERRWNMDTVEHRAMRAAFVQGAEFAGAKERT
jgi:hypothetical protein